MSRSILTAALCVSLLGVSAAPAAAKGIGSLFSCDAQGSANTKGAVVGGLVGALAGSQISKKNQALGAAIGAGLGAALGNNLGCRMDRKSRQDAETAFQRALDTGQAQTWSDAQTGANGRVEVLGRASPATPVSSSGRWRFADGVTPAQRVSNVGGTYSAISRANVRSAPSAKAAVIDRLQAGEQFSVSGAAAGGWLAIVESGIVQGYVAQSVTQPLGTSTQGDCRRVEQTVTEPGQSATREQFNACRSPSGEWNMTSI